MSASRSAAEVLRGLHVPGTPLVLPNVWDADSARIVADAGFPAVATGSAAVAASLGYDDHEQVPAAEMFAAVARITRVVSVPVTADLERGYGLDPAELVERIAASGAVGCNLEDSDPRTGAMVEVERQADFLAAVRAASDDADLGLVINARTDSFVDGTGTPQERLTDAVRRGRRYLAAGADCVYPILAIDAATIGTIVAETGGPVNALFRPPPSSEPTPSLDELARLGVARISFGPGFHRATRATTQRLVAAVRDGRNPYV